MSFLAAIIASGQSAASFTPASLPSIYAYYDATDLSTLWQDAARTTPVTTAGDPVRVIDDLSGNGHHIIAPSDAARGLYQFGGGVLMDGSNDTYVEASGTDVAIPVYLAMVYKKTSTTGAAVWNLRPNSNTVYIYITGATSATVGDGRMAARNPVAELADTANGEWNTGSTAVVDSLVVAGTNDVQVGLNPRVTAANTQPAGNTMTAAKVRLSSSGFGGACPAGTFYGGIVALADPASLRGDAKGWLATRGGITL